MTLGTGMELRLWLIGSNLMLSGHWMEVDDGYSYEMERPGLFTATGQKMITRCGEGLRSLFRERQRG